MSKAQFLTTPGGEELVVLPRAEFDRLMALASEAEADAADIAAYDTAKAEFGAGGGETVPPEISRMVLNGKSRLAAVRKWRDLSQAELAERVGIAQGYLSDLETRRRAGNPETIAHLAAALDVPVSWIG